MDQMEPPKEDFSVGPLSVLSESVKKNCQVVPAGGRWVVLSAGSFVGTHAGVERRSEYKGAGGPSRGEAVPHRDGPPAPSSSRAGCSVQADLLGCLLRCGRRRQLL